MAAIIARSQIAPEDLKLMLLAYGIDHAFRVIGLDEIAHDMAHASKEAIKPILDQLALEGLVTKFSGRYCFNRPIPHELRSAIERRVTTSGTMRKLK